MHHHRRRSGHGSANTSATDVRKAANVSDSKGKVSRPAPLTRRNTPQTVQKLGKSPREREREREEDRWFEEERESFPQFCMACEKQFVPQDERFLYCSEACRNFDRDSTSMSTVTYPSSHSKYAPSNYPLFSGVAEPRDIIPRASPSRPNSMHFSPQAVPSTTTATEALRSLSLRPRSPPSPSLGHYSSTIWPYIRSPAASPSSSYSRPTSGLYSSTFDEAYYGSTLSGVYSGSRPLPPRHPTYARPKSIELVTPMIGR